MSDQDKFINEVESRLTAIFKASKDGYKTPDIERHRLAGFIQAGVFLGLTSNAEMQVLMERVHQSVLGMSIKERRESKSFSWIGEDIDYAQYESPAYGRVK